MKWALVLALVLFCGLTRGQTENENGVSLDNSSSRLVNGNLLRNEDNPGTDDPDPETGNPDPETGDPDPVTDDPDPPTEDQCKDIKCQNGIVCAEGECPCSTKPGLSGEFCEIVDGCATLNSKCEAIKKVCIYDPTRSDKATCDCGDDKKFDGDTCKETCDDDANKCSFSIACKPIDGYKFCDCPNDLTGDKCDVITDCQPSGKYANCSNAGGNCTHSGTNSICLCEDNKEYDTLSKTCRATCDPTGAECENEADCEIQDGKNFCTCVAGLTGDLCQVITDCEKGKKYENCTSNDGHTCKFSKDGGNAFCECGGGKQFDTNKGLCRSTCDETKKCENGAKCEDQGGQTFCTCVEGLTGDLCGIINECLPSGKYGQCETANGNCTFSGGNAGCSCGTGKLFDLTEGQCKDACGTVICRNGAQCKDDKCECPTGLSGNDCGTVEGCTEDLKKICEKIPSKCIYDSKMENKASCKCAKENQKFDGGECKDCICGEKEECFFDKEKKKQCPCIENFSKNNGTCEKCDCGEFGTCAFDEEGNQKCDCIDKYKDKKGICDVCDCGEYGTCSFDGDAKKTCACNAKFAEENGTCVDCECGDEAKGCQFNNGVKTCFCNPKYADDDGTCSECDCGEISNEAKSCEFSEGAKVCTCASLHAVKDETCTACNCGNKTVVEDKGCEFKDDEKTCKCKNKYSQNEDSCEACYCGTNGKCSFVNGEKVCACNNLYEENSGTCQLCNCGKNGKCSFVDGKKTCTCEKGFEELDGKCKECDCGSNGDCSFENKIKKCACHGDSLDKNGKCIEPCETDEDCSHSTICAETKGIGHFCDCKDIYIGDKCEGVKACVIGELKDCKGSGGECSYNETKNMAVCECSGEKKFDKSLKICRNKCKSEEGACKHGAECVDELCVCPTGTSGDDCSTVDGCDKELKEKCENIKATCVYDLTNNATCQCNNTDLIYKNNRCTAIWCESKPCTAEGSVCIYGFGSAFCKCTKSRYYDYATNTCIGIDKCPLIPCKENEYCNDEGKCACDKNHVTDKDGGCKNERKKLCDDTPCYLNATCQEGKAIGTVKCECPRDTYLNPKSKTCEVMIKEEEKCKDKRDCGPFGYCVKKDDTATCTCKKELSVLDKNTNKCILQKSACLSKKILSNNPSKCDCSGIFKDSTNGITCEYMTCGDEAAQRDCKSKGAFCADKIVNKQRTGYECKCSAGQKLTTDKGCVDACSGMECSKNQQTCYLNEYGVGTCKCPPGFTKIETDQKTTCQLNVQFSYLLKELPVMKNEFLNKDQYVNKVKLNEYVIKSMKALSSQSNVFASVQNFRTSGDVLLCDVWLQFGNEAEQDVKRWRSQVVNTNDSKVLPPSLKLSSVELDNVKYEKLEFCSPTVYLTACGQGSNCDKDKKACYCMDGYRVIGTTVQVIGENTVQRCEDVDECYENKHACKANSTCMNTVGGYYCECDPGYHKKDGNESAECVELCSPSPCNNGDCAVKDDKVECSCKAGFKGSYCTESDDKLKQAQHSSKVVGAVLGTILAVTFVAIIAYVVKLKKNSYSEDFSTSPRDNSEMAERRGISNRGYQ